MRKRPSTRILLVDDWAARANRLLGLTDSTIVVEELSTLTELLGTTAADLADFTAIFVDFDLSAHRPECRPFPELVLPATVPGAPDDRVTATTGAAALLHLERVFQSAASFGRWTSAEASVRHPRLFAFVNTDETTGRTFAAAAHLWFGAEYFPSDLPESAGSWLHDLGAYVREQTQPALARSAAAAFGDLLASDINGDLRSLDVRPSTFEWLQVYLMSGGWNAGPQQTLDALYAMTKGRAVRGMRSPNRSEFWQRIWLRLYDEYNVFLVAFVDEEPLHEPGGVRNRGGDPLLEHLRSSSLFWTQPDVRLAHDRYRSRLGARAMGGGR